MQYVVIVGSPYVWCHADTKWSAAAFDAEYGERGSYGLSSVKWPVSPRLPNTSSVEICTNRKRCASSALNCWNRASDAFSIEYTPRMLVCIKDSGSAIERSTCDSAAQLTTVSIVWRCSSSATSAVSVMFPLTISMSLHPASDVGSAAYVIKSSTTTLLPALAARFANALPMKPSPPVTSIERWFVLAGMLKAKSLCQEVAVCSPRPQQARVSRHRELVR